MKKMKTVFLLLVVFLLLLLFAGFALGESAVLVTDMAGREIRLDAPATRIVALTASDCEILYALGAGDMLVGRGPYCDYPAEALAIPIVESGANTNVEQIVALEPQLVFMNTMAQSKEQLAVLEAAGIQIVVSDAADIAGVYDSIEIIGAVIGKQAEAEMLVAGMKTSFEEIAKSAAGDGSQTVYFEVSPLQWGLWTAGSGTFMDELATMLELQNIFADVTGWAEISQEQVIERDPDYIVTIAMYLGEGLLPEAEIAGRDGWQSLKAVKNGNILNANTDAISRPGPRLVEAAKELYAFFFEKEAVDPAA